jgi:hypothetical protein
VNPTQGELLPAECRKSGTYSIWLYLPDFLLDDDDGGRRTLHETPAFIVLYTWERAGVLGLAVAEAWAALGDVWNKPQAQWDSEYEKLAEVALDPTLETAWRGSSLGLATLIEDGDLRYVGLMPPVGKRFSEPLTGCEPKARPRFVTS